MSSFLVFRIVSHPVRLPISSKRLSRSGSICQCLTTSAICSRSPAPLAAVNIGASGAQTTAVASRYEHVLPAILLSTINKGEATLTIP